jgi:hypothetical protein
VTLISASRVFHSRLRNAWDSGRTDVRVVLMSLMQLCRLCSLRKCSGLSSLLQQEVLPFAKTSATAAATTCAAVEKRRREPPT